MSRSDKSKGECRFCTKTFSGRGFGKHLLACPRKKLRDEELNGKKRKGFIKGKIRILARNNPPVFTCEKCKKIATQTCQLCWDDYCDNCIEDHGCDDGYDMPLVNSPRTGVCGYVGDAY